MPDLLTHVVLHSQKAHHGYRIPCVPLEIKQAGRIRLADRFLFRKSEVPKKRFRGGHSYRIEKKLAPVRAGSKEKNGIYSIVLYQGTTLEAAEKLGFVSGHDFSRAVND
jgi:hypothetical protein